MIPLTGCSDLRLLASWIAASNEHNHQNPSSASGHVRYRDVGVHYNVHWLSYYRAYACSKLVGDEKVSYINSNTTLAEFFRFHGDELPEHYLNFLKKEFDDLQMELKYCNSENEELIERNDYLETKLEENL